MPHPARSVPRQTATRLVPAWLALTGAMLPAIALANHSPEPTRPNILVIFTDQQSAEAIGTQLRTGELRTPNIDSLARRGVLFNRAYCANPLCIPSRTSMLTGRYPHETGVQANKRGDIDPAAWPTIGSLLKSAGYATGYVGKWHLPYPITEPASGFDYTANIKINGIDSGIPTSVATFLRQKRDQPFLLFASFINPHNICEWPRGQPLPDGEIGEPPDPELCPPARVNLAAQRDEPDVMTSLRRLYQESPQFPVGQYTPTQWRIYRWAYYRMIEKTDARIGEILAELRATGQDANTVIIFTSDHGDSQGAHGWNQKTVFYEESSRVPFIICAPQTAAAGGTSRQFVQTGTDLLPTICDFAGVPIPAGLHGLSHRATAEGRAAPTAHPFVVASNRFQEGFSTKKFPTPPSGRMLRTERYKYCVYSVGQRRESLVDLELDPGETANLATDPAHRSILEEHRALLRSWSKRTGDSSFPYEE